MKKIILIILIASSFSFLSACTKTETPKPETETNQDITSQATADLGSAQKPDAMAEDGTKKPKIPKPPVDETEKEVRSILDQINKDNAENN